MEPTQKPGNVRLAKRSDEKQIFDLLMILKTENALFQHDDDCVMETIRVATEQRGGIIGVIEENGRLTGTIGLFLERFWYTKDWHVQEFWNFVHPDFRNSNAETEARNTYAKDLINFSKWTNEQMGLMLNIGIISTDRTAAKIRLYERQKLIKMGVFFMNQAKFDRNVAPESISA